MILNRFVNISASRGTKLSEVFELGLIAGILVFCLVPTKYVVPDHTEHLLGYYSDFTAVILYPSLMLAAFYILWRGFIILSRGDHQELTRIVLILGGFYVIYHVTNQQTPTILLGFSYLKIACALLVGYCVYKSDIWLKYGKLLLGITILFGTINAIIALIQFTSQQSIGLNIIGESPLDWAGYDIAKAVAHGTTYIRGYGLFPHPNIMSAVLATISILNLYLLTKTTQIPRFVLWSSYYIITAGLFVTFSRAGLLAFGFGFVIWWLFNYQRNGWKNTPILAIPILCLLIISAIFFPWLSQRASWSDQAVIERGILNKAGLEIIQDNWLLGTGPGSNLIVLHGKLSKQYNYWEIQPIHNFFLVTVAELGIAGVMLCTFILFLLFKIFRKTLMGRDDPEQSQAWLIALTSISVIIFTLFWFDHYFYTIWPVQLLLAIFLGLVAKEIKIPTKISE